MGAATIYSKIINLQPQPGTITNIKKWFIQLQPELRIDCIFFRYIIVGLLGSISDDYKLHPIQLLYFSTYVYLLYTYIINSFSGYSIILLRNVYAFSTFLHCP